MFHHETKHAIILAHIMLADKGNWNSIEYFETNSMSGFINLNYGVILIHLIRN